MECIFQVTYIKYALPTVNFLHAGYFFLIFCHLSFFVLQIKSFSITFNITRQGYFVRSQGPKFGPIPNGI